MEVHYCIDFRMYQKKCILLKILNSDINVSGTGIAKCIRKIIVSDVQKSH